MTVGVDGEVEDHGPLLQVEQRALGKGVGPEGIDPGVDAAKVRDEARVARPVVEDVSRSRAERRRVRAAPRGPAGRPPRRRPRCLPSRRRRRRPRSWRARSSARWWPPLAGRRRRPWASARSMAGTAIGPKTTAGRALATGAEARWSRPGRASIDAEARRRIARSHDGASPRPSLAILERVGRRARRGPVHARRGRLERAPARDRAATSARRSSTVPVPVTTSVSSAGCVVDRRSSHEARTRAARRRWSWSRSSRSIGSGDRRIRSSSSARLSAGSRTLDVPPRPAAPVSRRATSCPAVMRGGSPVGSIELLVGESLACRRRAARPRRRPSPPARAAAGGLRGRDPRESGTRRATARP